MKGQFAANELVLFGYSLGARVALSLLKKEPKFFKAIVLLSCHPGLASPEEISAREQSDTVWAQRFRKDKWEDLIESWNKQASLVSSIPRVVQEFDFDRSKLAKALEVFSLAKQSKAMSTKINVPAVVCWGERDLKFKALASRIIEQFEAAQTCQIPNSGHRIMADNPSYLLARVKEFLESL